MNCVTKITGRALNRADFPGGTGARRGPVCSGLPAENSNKGGALSLRKPENTIKGSLRNPIFRGQSFWLCFPWRGFLSGFGLKLLCGLVLISADRSAFSCPAYVFRAGKFIKEMSAGDVFIRFAETHIGENSDEVMDSQMGRQKRGDWKTAIRSHTKNWSPQQAEEFLNLFQERLGPHGALRLSVRSLYHLENLIPAQASRTEPVMQRLKNRMAFYDGYMGEEKTRERLFNSLVGFTDRDIEKTRELTRFLESWYGSKKTVVQIMERDLGNYSKTAREDIEPIMLFLEKHLGRSALIEMTLRDKRKKQGYLSLGKLRDLQKTVQTLIDEVIPPSPESDKIIKEGLLILAELQNNHLIHSRRMAQFLTTHFGEELTAEIMNKDLKVFAKPPFIRFKPSDAAIFDRYLKSRRAAAEFIKTHYKKLFSTARWEEFVKTASRHFPHPPWRNIWD